METLSEKYEKGLRNQLSVEQIESIEFMPIGMGQYPYKLKRVDVGNHPAANVAGYIRIGENYYKPDYDMRTQPPISSRKPSFLGKLFNPYGY